MKRKARRIFECCSCGGRWTEPTGIHPHPTRRGWCYENAKEVKPARKAKSREGGAT